MESFIGRSFDIIALKERRKRKIVVVLIFAIIIAILAVAAFAIYNWYINRQYSNYEVIDSISVKNSSSLEYIACEDGVIRYGRDGVTAINGRGEDIWGGSYDMANPKLDVCENSAVVADVGGTSLYAYRGKDTGVNFSVDYPIVQACISKQGVVAVLMEETSSNTIAIYDPFQKTKKLLVEIPTNVEEGYPVSIDISQDGQSLAAAYLCVTTGVVQSRVSFYNFTDVGKNVNCLVGAQNYDDTMIAEVSFLDSDHVCLFSEKGFYLWENMKQPKMALKKEMKDIIQSAFADESYVGMILDRGDGKSVLSLYDFSGKEKLSLVIADDYSQVQLCGDEIILNSDVKCAVYRINGVKKYEAELDSRISYMFKGSSRNSYMLIQNSKIKIIKLK